MIEISSKHDVAENGTPYFVLYMTKDGETKNVAFDPKVLECPYEMIENLEVGIRQLITSHYPEVFDPLYRSRYDLKKLERQKLGLESMIALLEKKVVADLEEKENERVS